MLIADYYTINSHHQEDGQTIFCITLNPHCSLYNGHFPDSPVAPGVCNIQMIKECVEQIMQEPLMMTEISLCRLTILMTPHTHQQLQLSIRQLPTDEENIKIQATLSHNNNICLEMKATFSPTNNLPKQ